MDLLANNILMDLSVNKNKSMSMANKQVHENIVGQQVHVYRCMVKFYLMTFLFSFSLFMDLLAINMEEEEEEPTPSSSLSFSWWVHPFRKSGFSQQGDGFVRCTVVAFSDLSQTSAFLSAFVSGLSFMKDSKPSGILHKRQA